MPAATRKLRSQARRNKRSPEGRSALGFGFRVGYWPCLRGPYIQVTFGTHRFDLWYGLATEQDRLDVFVQAMADVQHALNAKLVPLTDRYVYKDGEVFRT